jgi:hypothetical protein
LVGTVAAFLPPVAEAAGDGSIYWGAYTSGAPFDQGLLNTFEASIGKPESIVSWGQPWVMNKTLQPFQTSYFQTVRGRGSIPLITWGSWDLSGDENQPEFRLSSIADGKYDAYVRQWADDARAWGQPFFLRFDHEMNGWWQFPWAVQANGNQPADFVRAWRHVHDIFASVGANNVTWVWCPNISGPQTTPLAQVYPGDSYVDWMCLDGYNWGTDKGSTWQSFAQVFGGQDFGDFNPHNSYQEVLALAPSKPIMVGEVASSENGGSKGQWIADALQSQLPTMFPQIRAVVWMNWDAGDPSLSWPVDSSNHARAAFSQSIRAPWFASNVLGSLLPGVIQPPHGTDAVNALMPWVYGTAQ